MKKYFVLASVLALTACGGGSGGGAPYVKPVLTNAESFSVNQTEADDAKINYIVSKIPGAYGSETETEAKLQIANNLLTKMQATIETLISLKNSNDYDGLSDFITNNLDDVNNALSLYMKNYTPSSDLSEVRNTVNVTEFSSNALDDFDKLHGFVAGQMTPDDMAFNNNIRLHFTNGSLTGYTDMDGELIQLSQGGEYSESFDLTTEPGYVAGVWPTMETFKGKVVLLGNQVGLRYSDFGYDQTEYIYKFSDRTIDETDVMGLYGGYIPKEAQKPNNGVVFDGIAVAPLYVHTYDNQTDNFYTMISVSNDAQLLLQDDKEILHADFSSAENPWYDVTITKISDNYDGVSVTLAGNDDDISDLYKIKDRTAYANGMNVTYYGDNGVASEVVVGTSVYGSGVLTDPGNYTHEIDASVVFGGKN